MIRRPEMRLESDLDLDSVAVGAVQSLGLGFDVTSDFRLRFAKGSPGAGDRLVEVDEESTRDVVIPDAGTIHGVSKDIRCDKGDRIRFKSDVLEFNQVEELASLIKDNLSCKHLVLSIEEALINFLQNDTSSDGVLELEPMTPYHRLLLHRLADIYGFSHESVGEGNDRHLILERCPESSIPAVLVSDILWQYDHDEFQSPMPSRHLLKKEDAVPETKMKQTSFPHSMSLEEREAAYLAARQRIFSLGEDEVKLPVTPKQRNIPVVARRMIAHALGQRICSRTSDDKHTPPNNEEANVVLDMAENKDQISSGLNSSENSILSSGQSSSVHGRKACSKRISKGSVNCKLNTEGEMQSQEVCHGSSNSVELQTGYSNRVGDKNNLEQQHLGAAKRMFANALGLPSAKQNQGIIMLKCGEASNHTTKDIKG